MLDLTQFDRLDLECRLLSHVPWRPVFGCWLVEGLWRDKDGYPILCVGAHRLRANRVAYYVWNGDLRRLALHECDTPPCIRPDHLYDGTYRDNAVDRERRRRRQHLGMLRRLHAGQLEFDLDRVAG